MAALVAWNVLRLIPAAQRGPFPALDLFGWILFAPAPLLATVAISRRAWVAVALMALPVALFGIEYGPQFAPHRVPEEDAIRVVTANVHVSNRRPEDLGPAFAALDADVIAVQELDGQAARSLSRALRGRLRYRAVRPREDPYGFGIYSRHPLDEVAAPQIGPETCYCQIAEIRLPRGSMRLLNTHIPPPDVAPPRIGTSHQTPVVAALLREVRARRSVVLAGDLNISDRHHLFRRLRGELGDSYRDAGWGFGFTWRAFGRPFVRIDHVLHDERWRTKAVRTARVVGSDHRAVVADLVPR